MSNKSYCVSIFVQVSDVQRLHKAARESLIASGISEKDADEHLLHEGDNGPQPDVSACLRQLLDPGESPPGCEILDSTCE